MANIQIKVYRADAINSPNVERYVTVSKFGGNTIYGYGKSPEEAVGNWLENITKKELIKKEVVKDSKGYALDLT